MLLLLSADIVNWLMYRSNCYHLKKPIELHLCHKLFFIKLIRIIYFDKSIDINLENWKKCTLSYILSF